MKRTKAQVEFETIFKKFIFNINSLRTYIKSVSLSLDNQKSDQKFVESLDNAIELLIRKKINPSEFNDHNEKFEELEEKLKEKFNLEIDLEEPETAKVTMTGGLTGKIKDQFESYKLNKNQVNILYQSSLISLATFFELLVASIIKKRLFDYPSALNIDERSLTLEEIRKLGSFENAEIYLIENEVEQIMRKNILDWIEYMKKNYKSKFLFLTDIEAKLFEVFQRRNLFVHNEGIVNNIYLSRVNQDLVKDFSLGKKIIITNEYMDETIDLIEYVGVILALELWQKFEKVSMVRQDLIQEYGFEFMLQGKWKLSREVFSLLINEREIGNRSKTMGLINYWQSFKNLNEYDQVIGEIEKEDFSDRSLDFQLCFFALKDDFNNFFNILPEVCPSEISLEHLKKWPIFNSVRQTAEYEAFIEKMTNTKNEIIS
ncbi:hypothetical protein IFU39_19870 [Paenibacillus sp. CFBP 13594]|uniref:hypothetical protein n=1 Tax=Paenibacillus sp. CFBP 13594 TaxID=2774037 RepID=UPI001783EDA4|nr:hypothetical protein [Paenibacillus sp. CFBP 13594]MBD8840071.1 hypothetical protein [Paenibacillus sp. CFBP 13594]